MSFFIRSFSLVFAILIATASSSMAASGHDHLPASAEEVFSIGSFVVTNSMIMVWIVAALLIIVAQLATKNITLPGVGTMGWMLSGDGVDPHDTFRPFLRGGNADLNMTGAMAITFAILWFYWSITETSLKDFGAHIFAPKGNFKGLMMIGMIVIFFAVGLIEVFSIALRPVALMFRLYGNVYAGENMLESIMNTVPVPWLKWLAALPFYFLELLVGLIQALVFTLLCAVFLKLMCDHGDHDEEHAH